MPHLTTAPLARHHRTPALSSALALLAIAAVMRNLPLFFSARPATPLRVLCIIAFDTLHHLRHGRPLSASIRSTLATVLDLGAAANASLDQKPASPHTPPPTLHHLSPSFQPLVHDYLQQVRLLETHRPSPAGPASHFHTIVAYRESVVLVIRL